MLAFLILAASLIQWLAIGFIAVAALAVAGASAVYFLRARSFEKTLGSDAAPIPMSTDGLAEMREIGQRIETLVGQQALQGETQRQVLAQQIDTVGQRVDEHGHHVDGLKNELRHEVRRRDAELDEIRHQLASIQQSGLALGAGSRLALPSASDHAMPVQDVSTSSDDDAVSLTADSLEGDAFDADLGDVLKESETIRSDDAARTMTPPHPVDDAEMDVSDLLDVSGSGAEFTDSLGGESWDLEEPAWDLGGSSDTDSFNDPFAYPLEESFAAAGADSTVLGGLAAALPGDDELPAWAENELAGDSGDSGDESMLTDIFATVAFEGPSATSGSAGTPSLAPLVSEAAAENASAAPLQQPVTPSSPFVFENATGAEPMSASADDLFDDGALLEMTFGDEGVPADDQSASFGDSVDGAFKQLEDATMFSSDDFTVAPTTRSDSANDSPKPPADSAWVSVSGRSQSQDDENFEAVFDASAFDAPEFVTAERALDPKELLPSNVPTFDAEPEAPVPAEHQTSEVEQEAPELVECSSSEAAPDAATPSVYPTFEAAPESPVSVEYPSVEAESDAPASIDFPTFEAAPEPTASVEYPSVEAEPDAPASIDFPTFEAAPESPVSVEYPSVEAEPDAPASIDFPTFEAAPESPVSVEYPSVEAEPDAPASIDFPTFEAAPEPTASVEYPSVEAEPDAPASIDFPTFEAAPEPTASVEYPSFEAEPDAPASIDFPTFEAVPEPSVSVEYPSYEAESDAPSSIDFPTFEAAPEPPASVEYPSFEPEPDAPASIDFPTFEAAPEPPAPIKTSSFVPESDAPASIDFPTFEAAPEAPAAVEYPSIEAEPDALASIDFPTIEAAPEAPAAVDYPSFEAEPDAAASIDFPTFETTPENQAEMPVPADEAAPATPAEDFESTLESEPETLTPVETSPVAAVPSAQPEAAPAQANAELGASSDGNDPAPFVAPEGADDLTVISTVDEDTQRLLYLAGVTKLDDIARWSRSDARRYAVEALVSEETIMNQWIFEAQSVLFDRFSGSI